MSTGNEELDKAIELAGYSYDSIQDIFYSTMDPWQRDVGYCRLYDEAAAPLGMIIDCEPIYFDYQGKKWMISFWKGQYDMVTGGEIGIYIATREITLQGLFSGTFYQAASNEHCLPMSYTLNKNGKPLFTREGKHWWLTGFKLGEFSEPLELTMDIRISLNDVQMRNAFITGLLNAGYSYADLDVSGNAVALTFDIPHTPQPMTRTRETDKLIQRKNLLLCEQYQALTDPYDTVPKKIKALEGLSPDMYKKVINIGKTKKMYEMYTSIVIIGTFLLSRLAGGIDKTKQLLR
ncbi:DUF4474 domain-containing protein [Desulfitobacterium metallireducens]|uniref:DUF4474 domain-containing protein n=1 Tax=Desulfitobacterium metallireducens DSM 15288 TaxID=871968 RepID=W0E8B4_9FIRM|nr:DUF4474 domain-containing protein [Desulfitobacterium metallireducens]AHF07105.1 hypothetical protein DESME_08480 [Desulfitobacterium metallireducens DSM 15288]